ncbi:MAG: thaumatin family protein, partial [Polyangiales bacterium]
LITRSTVLVGGLVLLFASGCGDTGGAGGEGAGGPGGAGGNVATGGTGGLATGGTGGSASESSGHTFTLVNNCDEPIWLASNSESPEASQDWALAARCTGDDACADGQTCSDNSCTCSADADCVLDSTADTTAKCDMTSNKCVRTTTVNVAAGWSGRFWARTRCSGSDTEFVCKTGQCGPTSGSDIDCGKTKSTANLATLFEITTAGFNGEDNFDVSLVSGYNVPMIVTAVLPDDSAQWQANMSFDAGAQIVEMVGENTFGYTQSSATGVSGATEPVFPGTWTDSVSDGAISWINIGPVCERSGCQDDLNVTCPSVLQVLDGAGGAGGAMPEVIACDAPANACLTGDCSDNLDYYQCQNNGGPTDLFSEVLVLQSPNAETYVCFSSDDCPAGTTCTLNPAFESGFTLPMGTGLCLPVTQNGGCAPGDDGEICPDRDYPFVDYHCQTLSGEAANAQVCIPPKVTGLGDLWWNAANWTQVSPVVPCTADSTCTPSGANDKCLADAINAGQKQCPEGDSSCSCYTPNPCSSARGTNSGCPDPKQCLNDTGEVDGIGADCTTETCYCGPQGVFSGPCGPMNPDWNTAASDVGDWAKTFKTACPAAYSYQYDDPSSNWSCPNPSDDLVDYKIDFCLEIEPL